MPAGNPIKLGMVHQDQLSTEAISNPGLVGKGSASGEKTGLLSNPLFIASDEGHSNHFEEGARASDDEDFAGNEANMQRVVDQMTDEDLIKLLNS